MRRKIIICRTNNFEYNLMNPLMLNFRPENYNIDISPLEHSENIMTLANDSDKNIESYEIWNPIDCPPPICNYNNEDLKRVIMEGVLENLHSNDRGFNVGYSIHEYLEE
jgi:hypothetical protein